MRVSRGLNKRSFLHPAGRVADIFGDKSGNCRDSEFSGKPPLFGGWVFLVPRRAESTAFIIDSSVPLLRILSRPISTSAPSSERTPIFRVPDLFRKRLRRFTKPRSSPRPSALCVKLGADIVMEDRVVPNTAPYAPDELWWTHAGQSVSSWPGVSDDDGDELTLAVASQPGHGTVTTDGYNEFLYTPNPDFLGTDSFTYSASDGFPGGTSTGTITVTVEPPFVTIESWQGTIEGSPTPGWFRFTRTGPTVSDLTVDYTIDNPTEFEVATPGKDYQVFRPGPKALMSR